MAATRDNVAHRPRIHAPYITILFAVLIPLFTVAYTYVFPLVNGNRLAMWLTSPFNIFFEMYPPHGITLNYLLPVAIFFLVEIYSRYVADIKERNSTMNHAFGLAVIASYATSALIWALFGMPAIGTSVLAFCMLLFFVSEVTDSELINRLRERHRRKGYVFEVLMFAYSALLLGSSVIVFAYINGNQYWFIHLIGGSIFAIMLFAYLMHRKTKEKTLKA